MKCSGYSIGLFIGNSGLRYGVDLLVSQVLPEYPVAQVHVNESTPSVQVAPFLQGSVAHSSMSSNSTNIYSNDNNDDGCDDDDDYDDNDGIIILMILKVIMILIIITKIVAIILVITTYDMEMNELNE